MTWWSAKGVSGEEWDKGLGGGEGGTYGWRVGGGWVDGLESWGLEDAVGC